MCKFLKFSLPAVSKLPVLYARINPVGYGTAIPFAYIDNTLSSIPLTSFVRFGIAFGSKLPSRSLGTETPSFPYAVLTALWESISPCSIDSNTGLNLCDCRPSCILFVFSCHNCCTHFFHHPFFECSTLYFTLPKESKIPLVISRGILYLYSYFNILSSVLNKLSISIGFGICPFMPLLKASCLSSSNALAVIAIIGIEASSLFSSFLIAFVAS